MRYILSKLNIFGLKNSRTQFLWLECVFFCLKHFLIWKFRSSYQRYSVKEAILTISQISQENNGVRASTTDETFQQSGKQDSLRHIYVRSGLLFFKSTTGSLEEPPLWWIKVGYYLCNHQICKYYAVSD